MAKAETQDQKLQSPDRQRQNHPQNLDSWIVLILVGLNAYAFFEFLDRIRLYLWRALAVQSPLTMALNIIYALIGLLVFSSLARLSFVVKAETREERNEHINLILQTTLLALGLFLASEVILARLLAGGLI